MTHEKALNLDQKAQLKFIDFYNKEISSEPRVFHAFDRGEYYSIHGSDIDIALKTSLKSSIITKIMRPNEKIQLKYSSLNKATFEKLVKELLLVHFYRVEVYTHKNHEYFLSYKGSPGNLIQFENLIYNSSESEILSNLLLSVQVSTSGNCRKVGLSAIDSDEHLVQVAEIEDSDFYMELEAALVILSPKEVLLPSITGDYARIKEIMDRNNMLVTVVKKSDFSKTSDFCQDLEKLYRFKKGQQKNIHAIPEVKLDLAMGALAAGIKYLETVKEEGNLGKFNIKILSPDRFVHMDSATFSALHLFPPPAVNHRSTNYKWQSILGVLDRCHTTQGRRMLHTWLKQPLRNLEMINERLDIVESLAENQEARMLLNKELNCIPDILMLTNKLSRKRASLQDVFKIYQVIMRLPGVLKILKELDCKALSSTIHNRLGDLIQDLTKLEELVDEVLDMESIERGEYLVRASFDEKLNDIKTSMTKTEKQLESRTRKYANILGLEEGASLKLDYASHLGFFLRANRKEDQNIRKNKQFRVIDTARNNLRFTTDEISEYSAEYTQFKELYEEQQKEIVAEICRVASGYSTPLTSLNHLLATLDVFLSLAQVATNSPGIYVRPKMYPENERILQLTALRHPCLEHQEDIQYIPNDIDLKGDESEFLIITGANISGKSTYIRSVGIAVLLAQIGSFVPCDDAKISICDSILARIGAADDIQKNLSTFAMEMVETSSILKSATKNSLIIIDELGRGTSTFEGLGLAWSISEYLAKEVKCFTLFATHFHEITKMADTLPNVKNYHLASIVEGNKLTLLFKVKEKAMTKSFGIEVAEIAQLPKHIVDTAKQYLNELEMEDSADKENEEVLVKIDGLLEKAKIEKNFDVLDTLLA